MTSRYNNYYYNNSDNNNNSTSISNKNNSKIINLSQNKYWTAIFMILTTGVYLVSETLQLSPLISDDSHYKSTVYTFSYDLLYSWLIAFVILKINKIIISSLPSRKAIIGYALSYFIGAIGFALLGEIPCLHDIAIVPNFWDHLQPCAKWTIAIFSVIIGLLGFNQCKRAILDRDFLAHFVPYLLFLIGYGTILATLIYGKASEVNIHVHHAIGASLLSFWFTDWNNRFSMMFHGVLMGVAIEGINFYGIGELSLFLCNNSTQMDIIYMIPLLSIWLIIALITLPYLINQQQKKNKKSYSYPVTRF